MNSTDEISEPKTGLNSGGTVGHRGSDMANLWMNLCKVLIVLVFVLHSTLYEQLGLDIFRGQPYYALASELWNPNDIQLPTASQILTEDNTVFFLDVLPLTISEDRYSVVEVAVVSIRDADHSMDPIQPASRADATRSISWPDVSGDDPQHPVASQKPPYRVPFDLNHLAPGLAAGNYDIHYTVRFSGESGKSYFVGRSGTVSSIAPDPADQHSVNVTLTAEVPVRFGLEQVTQGRAFTIAGLEGKQGCSWSDDGMGLDSLPAAVAGADCGAQLRVNTPGTYGLVGQYRVNEEVVPFTLTLLVLENAAPRLTFQGSQFLGDTTAGPELGNSATLLMDQAYSINVPESVDAFSLDSLIVDPDNEDSTLRPATVSLQPTSLEEARSVVTGTSRERAIPAPTGSYEVYQEDGGNRWLIVRDAPPRTRIHVVTLKVSDGFHNKSVRFRVLQ